MKKKWSGFRYRIICGTLDDKNGANDAKVDANNGAYIEGEVGMVKNIMRDPMFLGQKSEDATEADRQIKYVGTDND